MGVPICSLHDSFGRFDLGFYRVIFRNGTWNLIFVYEPFLGGGAAYLAIQPTRAVLSDANSALISFYQTCVMSPRKVVERARQHSNTSDGYYQARQSQPWSDLGKAGRFLYLNKTCWGGVYRLNRKGEFNVPYGDSSRNICNETSVVEAAKVFKKAAIQCCDFETTMKRASSGDVVFADPPYTSKGQFNGFVRYNEKLFSWDDQLRLQKAAKAARSRGAFVIVCGSYHRDIIALYKNWWVLEVKRKSLVARKTGARQSVSECLLMSRRPKNLLNGLERITADFIRSFPHNEG